MFQAIVLGVSVAIGVIIGFGILVGIISLFCDKEK
jgi:hypothetical protein